MVMRAAVAGRGGARQVLRRRAEAVRGRAVVVVVTLAVSVALIAGVYEAVRAVADALSDGGSAPQTAAGLAALAVVALPMIAATVLYDRGAAPLEPAYVLDELQPRRWDEVLTRGTAHALSVALVLGGLAMPVVSAGPAQATPLTPTTTSIIGYGPDQPHVGDAITVTVQVDHGATGTVTVDEGATQLGSAQLVDNGFLTQAQVNIGSLSAGTHSVTAHYGGDSSFAASTSSPPTDIVVRPVSDVLQLGASPNPGTYHQAVTITATVLTSSGTATGTVGFFQDGTSLGSPVALDGTGAATFTITSAEAGQFDYTAHYSGDTNHPALDATPYTEQVPSPTTLALTGPNGPVV